MEWTGVLIDTIESRTVATCDGPTRLSVLETFAQFIVSVCDPRMSTKLYFTSNGFDFYLWWLVKRGTAIKELLIYTCEVWQVERTGNA